MAYKTNQDKKPEFSARSSDPNMMISTDFSFVRKHWYVGIKTVALYLIFAVLTSSFELPLAAVWLFSAILMVLWVYFDYTDIYRLAMRDYNLVKFNYLEYDEKRGLKTGIMAQIPGLVSVILMVILNIGSATWSDAFRMVWLIFYSPFAVIVGALQTMTGTNALWISAPFYLIPIIIQPIIGYLAYKNGYNNKGIFYKLIYKSRDKDKRLR